MKAAGFGIWDNVVIHEHEWTVYDSFFSCVEGVSSWCLKKPPLLGRIFGHTERCAEILDGKVSTLIGTRWRGVLYIVREEMHE